MVVWMLCFYSALRVQHISYLSVKISAAESYKVCFPLVIVMCEIGQISGAAVALNAQREHRGLVM